jgi:hypothetical protein
MNVTNILGLDDDRLWNGISHCLTTVEGIGKWDWVHLWMEGFARINKSRKGTKSTCVSRMKIFSQNPDVRRRSTWCHWIIL